MTAPTAGRALVLSRVKERPFQAQVEIWARRAGWLAYHSWSSLHSARGFPDLCLVRGTRLLFVELKTSKGEVTQSQREWLQALSLVPGIEVYVFRPADEATIKEVLGLG